MKDDLKGGITAILELDRVLGELARYCVSEDVKAAAESLSPFCAYNNNGGYADTSDTAAVFRSNIGEISVNDTSIAACAVNAAPAADIPQPQILRSADDVRRELTKVKTAADLASRFTAPVFTALSSPLNAADRARKGQTLTLPELRKIGRAAGQAVYLRKWRDGNSGEYDAAGLEYLFDTLDINLKRIAERIERCIVSDDELADDASPQLSYIRGKLRRAKQRVRSSLEKIVKDRAGLLQEQIITTRDGRYVIPVRAEHKGEFGGFIHDVSGSGATLFIEPAETVEQSNEIRLLQCEEEDEIRRITRELSEMCGAKSAEIRESYGAACELELYFAKSAYGESYRGTAVRVVDDAAVRLAAARHPLLLLRQGGGTVVPVDIAVGGSEDNSGGSTDSTDNGNTGTAVTSLIITGANAGGKTAALKTAGLLTLMCYCGLMLPADDISEVGSFTRVFADIGDNQSLENNLSTFSAHMSNIAAIANAADDRSLVLLDELASGTDPAPGGTLAVALLEYFKNKGSRVIATSHYQEVKIYATDTAGAAVACSEFDTATLTPTYRLIRGIPGKSYALDVARRYGIPENVVADAEHMMSGGDRRFEDAIAAVNERQSELSREIAAVQAEKREQFELNVKLRKRLDGIEKEKARAVAAAKRDADKIIAGVTAEAERLIAEINENAAATDNARAVKNSRNRLKSRTGKMRDIANPVADKIDNNGGDNSAELQQLKVGGEVKLIDTGVAAVVVTLPDGNGNLTVQTGLVKIKTNIRRLAESHRTETAAKTAVTRGNAVSSHGGNAGTRLAGTELDVRGCTAEECLYNVERFIDGAVMDGHHTVTIIHGKGGGILRKTCETFLRRYTLVKSFRGGEYGEGDTGVTVVTLAE